MAVHLCFTGSNCVAQRNKAFQFYKKKNYAILSRFGNIVLASFKANNLATAKFNPNFSYNITWDWPMQSTAHAQKWFCCAFIQIEFWIHWHVFAGFFQLSQHLGWKHLHKMKYYPVSIDLMNKEKKIHTNIHTHSLQKEGKKNPICECVETR